MKSNLTPEWSLRRSRLIFELRRHGYTYKDIGKELDISAERVRYLVIKALITPELMKLIAAVDLNSPPDSLVEVLHRKKLLSELYKAMRRTNK